MPEAWILLHSTGRVLLLHSINRVSVIVNLKSESETKKNTISASTRTYTTWQWQSRTQAKMTQKHIQAKANTDKLCKTKQNQRYSPIKKKQHNLSIQLEPFPRLEFSPPLESCSDIRITAGLLWNHLFLRNFAFLCGIRVQFCCPF